MIWATRSVHLFAVIVWLGGMFYQGLFIVPRLKAEHGSDPGAIAAMVQFIPIGWMCLSMAFVTGVALMLFSPRFLFFQYHDYWSIALGLKQLTFVLMSFFFYGNSRMLKLAVVAPEHAKPALERVVQFSRINVALSILVIGIAVSMR